MNKLLSKHYNAEINLPVGFEINCQFIVLKTGNHSIAESNRLKPGMVTHTFAFCTEEAEVGGSL